MSTTTVKSDIYIPESIHSPCELLDEWGGWGSKQTRKTLVKAAMRGILGRIDKTSISRGLFFNAVTREFNDYWKGSYNTLQFPMPSYDSDAHGASAFLIIKDKEGYKTALTSHWRPAPGAWVLAPQSAMVDVTPNKGSKFASDTDLSDTILRGIEIKTGFKRDAVTFLHDDGDHLVHPGVENTLKGFSYALVEFDGVLAKDGSNLPITIPTRKDVTQGDGRPPDAEVREWDTTVCRLGDLSEVVDAYERGEFSGVDVTLAMIHETVSREDQNYVEYLLENSRRKKARQERCNGACTSLQSAMAESKPMTSINVARE